MKPVIFSCSSPPLNHRKNRYDIFCFIFHTVLKKLWPKLFGPYFSCGSVHFILHSCDAYLANSGLKSTLPSQSRVWGDPDFNVGIHPDAWTRSWLSPLHRLVLQWALEGQSWEPPLFAYWRPRNGQSVIFDRSVLGLRASRGQMLYLPR